MANEFIIRKGLVVNGSGSTVVDIQGSQGQLFSITDDLTGTLFAVSDISGIPILKVDASGESLFDGNLSVSGSLRASGSASHYLLGANVGIGTTSPSEKLHIEDIANPKLLVKDSNGAGIYLQAFNSYGILSSVGSTSTLRLAINDLEKMRITPDGFVGIGTTNPDAKLQVYLPSNTANQSIFKSDAGDSLLQINTFPTTNRMQLLVGSYNGTNTPNIASIADTNTGIQLSGNDIIRFVNGGSENVTITSNGNVGIGTTAPARQLHQYSTSNNYFRLETTATNGYAGIEFKNDVKTFTVGVNNSDAFVITPSAQFAGGYPFTVESSAHNQSFKLKTGGNVVTNLLTGNFGIGTETPSYKLDVHGDANITGSLTVSGSTIFSGDLTVDGIVTAREFHTQFVSASIIYQSGSTKFGDTSDDVHEFTGSLEVSSSIKMTKTGHLYDYPLEITNDSIKLPSNNSGVRSILRQGGTSTGGFLSLVNGSGNETAIIRSYSNAGVQAFFTAGNVGIGTTSPSEKLEVSEGYILASGASTSHGFELQRSGADTYQLRHLDGGLTIFNSTDSRKEMTFDGDGNVGIGTTSPSNQLEISSGGGVSNPAVLGINSNDDNTAVAGSYIYLKDNSATKWQVGKNALQDFIIYDNTAGGNKFRIIDNGNILLGEIGGNVGIGITNPTFKLDVQSTTNDVLRVASPSPAITLLDGTSNDWKLQAVDNSRLRIYHGGSAGIFNLLLNGNLGLGTDSPSQKLHVVGNLRVTGAYYDSNNSAGTSGQVLSSTATGTDWVSLSEISGVDGTGTANYVAKWSDADTITNSVIYDNGTNVGINTTSPAAKFHVQGTALLGSTFSTVTSYINKIEIPAVFGDQGGNRLSIAGLGTAVTEGPAILSDGRNLTIGSYDNGEIDSGIRFNHTNNTPNSDTVEILAAGEVKLIVSASGNVGIGTTNPNAKLHVDGDAIITGKVTAQEFHTQFVSASIIYQSGSTKFGDTSDDVHNFTGSINLKTNNQNYYISGSDSVLRIGSKTTANKIQLELYHAVNPVSLGINYSGGSALPYIESVHPAFDTNTHLLFKPGGTESWRIGSHGTNHTYGQAFSIKPAASGNDFYIADETNAPILYSDTSTRGIGIGTTTPDSKLHLATSGGTTLTIQNTTNSGNASLHFRDEGDVNQYQIYYALGANRAYNLVNGNGLTVYSSQVSAEIARFGTSSGYTNSYFTGNVGIGTTSPGSKLHVEGDVRIGSNKLKLGGGNADSYIQHDGINLITFFQSNWGGDFKFRAADFSGIQHDILFIEGTNQRVGIGTTSPEEKLQVNGNIKITDSVGPYLNLYRSDNIISSGNHLGSIVFGGGPEAYQDSPLDDSAIVLKAQAAGDASANNSPSRLIIQGVSNNSSALSDWVVFEDSNVGIGTTSPAAKLSIGDGLTTADVHLNKKDNLSSGYYIVNEANPSGRTVFLRQTIGEDAEIGTSSNNDLSLITNSSTRVFITDTGNVGIGTTSPIQKLHVVGNGYINAGSLFIDSGQRLKWGNSNQWIEGTNDTSLEFSGGGGGTQMILTSAGNVGIGTTIPAKQLHLQSSEPGIRLQDSDGSDQWGQIRQTAANLVFTVRNGTSNGQMNFQTYDGTTTLNTVALKTNNQVQFTQYGSGTFTGTATQRLAVDSSGNVIEIPIGSGPVDGSGTANRIPLWEDSDTIGNSDIVQTTNTVTVQATDASAGYSRIRLVSPSGSSLSLFEMVFGDDANNAPVVTYSRGDNYPTINSFSRGTGVTNPIFFAIDSSEKMRIHTNGNVGIGTTSPTLGKLHVAQSSDSVTSGIAVEGISGGNSMRLWLDGSTRKINAGGSSTMIQFDTSQVAFPTGNVGIGTLSPSRKLEVRSSTSTYVARFYGSNSSYITSGTGSLSGESGYVAENSTGAMFLAINSGLVELSGTSGATGMKFSLGGTEKMRIDSSGNVGIGTTSPAYKLDVSGSGRFTDGLTVTGTTTFDGDISVNSRILTPNNTSLKLYPLGSGHLYLGDAGNGMNMYHYSQNNDGKYTTFTHNGTYYRISPTATSGLEITSNTKVSGDLTVTGIVTAQEFHTQFVSASIIYQSGSTKFGDSSDDNHSFTGSLQVSGSAEVDKFLGINTKASTEKIGIGPSSEVSDNSSSYQLKLISADNYSGILTTYQYGSSLNLKAGVTGNGYANKWTSLYLKDGGTVGNGYLTLNTTGLERLRIDSAGNVGIGTTSPNYKLDINGFGAGGVRLTSANFYIDYGSYTGGWARGYLIQNSDASDQYGITGQFNNDSFVGLRIGKYNYDNKGIFVASSGNVGIGTTSPAYKLSVSEGTIGTDFSSTSISVGRQVNMTSANTSGMGVFTRYTSNTAATPDYFGQYGFYFNGGTSSAAKQYQLYVGDAATPRMIMTAAGRMGIGTTAPSYPFEVNGGTLNTIANFKSTDAGAYISFSDNSTTSGEYVQIGASGDGMVIRTGNAQAVTIASDGDVGIGTTTPDATAILDIVSTTKGVVFPRMTKVQRASIVSPTTGLIVYQTDSQEGLYIYKSTGWVQII